MYGVVRRYCRVNWDVTKEFRLLTKHTYLPPHHKQPSLVSVTAASARIHGCRSLSATDKDQKVWLSGQGAASFLLLYLANALVECKGLGTTAYRPLITKPRFQLARCRLGALEFRDPAPAQRILAQPLSNLYTGSVSTFPFARVE